MILTAILGEGTLLANVRYRWIAGGVYGSALTDGITQPTGTYPIFRIDAEPPADAEEMVVYDNSDATNWNVAGYMAAFMFAKVNQVPADAPALIIPGPSGDASLCRVYGYFEDLNNQPAEKLTITFELVGTQPEKSERIIARTRKVTCTTDDQGRLVGPDGNPWVDLQKTSNLTPASAQYLVTITEAGIAATITLTTDTFDLATLIT